MSKELRRKVIEAGIIPTHSLKLMKQWRCVDEDLPDGGKSLSQQQLLEFVDEIAVLLEEEGAVPEVRETDLEVRRQLTKNQKQCRVITHERGEFSSLTMMDASGFLVFYYLLASEIVQRGSFVLFEGKAYLVTAVMVSYRGEDADILRAEVVEVDDAEVPQLLEADEK